MAKVYQTPPLLATLHPSLFNAFEIEQFENTILIPDKVPERVVSEFFSRYPKFLLLGEGKEIRREVSLFSANGRPIGRVDFFRQSYGQSYWDIIELKKPEQQLLSAKHGKHPHASDGVRNAVDQALDYRKWIDVDSSLRARLLQKGILVYHPQIIVVVGRDRTDVKPELMRDIFDRIRQGPIDIRSYSDIYRFAKEHYSSNRLIIMFGQFGRSRVEVSSDIVFEPYSQKEPPPPLGGRWVRDRKFRDALEGIFIWPSICPQCGAAPESFKIEENDPDHGVVALGPTSYSELRVCQYCGTAIVISSHVRRGTRFKIVGYDREIRSNYLKR